MAKKLSQAQADVLQHCRDTFWVGYLGWCSRATADSLVRKGYFVETERDVFKLTDKGREKQAQIKAAFR